MVLSEIELQAEADRGMCIVGAPSDPCLRPEPCPDHGHFHGCPNRGALVEHCVFCINRSASMSGDGPR